MAEQYDVKCPKCGHINKDLFLYETEGRYICECCHSEHQDECFKHLDRLPLLTTQQSVAQLKR